jgi:CHAD domain-containing protein
VQPAPPPVERPPIQAVVPAQEQKKLKALAQARKKEVRATLAKMSSRRLSADDQDLVKRIEFFLAQSVEAEGRGDMSQADVFAQRAQDLARGWQGGR